MSFAIKWGELADENSGLIYFNATTAFTENFSGKVTSHPVDFGGNISDHYIRDNPKFSLSGVITGADLSTSSFLIQDLDGNLAFNTDLAPNPVSVSSTNNSVLSKFLPSSISQFIPDTTPEVIVDPKRTDILPQIKQLLIELTDRLVFNESTQFFDHVIQLVSLVEYKGTTISSIKNNLVITSIDFKEDATTGRALYVDIKFEQVTFAFLRKTEIPSDVINALKNKASSKSNKQKQDSQVKDVQGPPENDDSPDPVRANEVAQEAEQ